MVSSLAHRGPDDEDYFLSQAVSLGYRRLAIIDLERGGQPIFNEDETLVIVYNGEIYNYRELRDQLEDRHHFRTNSDTEVIVHLYEEHGEEAFPLLNGMFAFALFDRKANRLILARDRLGIKPLYYFVEGDKLYFASEIKALLRCKKTLPNDRQIYQYLVYRLHDHSEETFFEGIKRLLPGTYLVLSEGRVSVQKYWQPKVDGPPQTAKEDELAQRFATLFETAVRRQLISEVPIGTSLSGGLDSSSVVMVINSLLKQGLAEREVIGDRQKTFSAVFPGEINDESDYVNCVTRAAEVQEHLVFPSRDNLWDQLETVIYHQDEPFVSTGIFAQWEVVKAASSKVKVLLDGQGADELLAGYVPYHFVYLRQLLTERKPLRLLKEILFALDVLWKPLIEQLKLRLGIIQAIDPDTLLRRDFVEGSRSTPPPGPSKDDLNRRLVDDLTIFSLPALLRYQDRNSMAFGVESRVPFLDNDLVDFVLSLPAHLKIRNGWNKYIMRRSLRGYLPPKIIRRRWKVGFTTPEVSWLRAEKDQVLAIFESAHFRSRKYFDAQKVVAAFHEFIKGKTDDSLLFWRILNLELWLRVFFDGDPHERFRAPAIAQSGQTADH